MTERERRQRRLLAVRSLQTDLAAAQLRSLRADQEQDERQLAELKPRFHVDAAAAPAHTEWLMACADRELAALNADALLAGMEQRSASIAAAAELEKTRRQAQEQMHRLCQRTEDDRKQTEQRADQSRLDDVFSAGRLRRLTDHS